MARANKKYIVWGIAALAVISIFYYAYNFYNSAVAPGKYDDFAQCTNDKGLVMYGAYWCSHCKAQKEMFGKSFRLVNYVECTEKGDLCDEKGVEGYPTWITAEGTSLVGEQSLQTLSQATGCALP